MTVVLGKGGQFQRPVTFAAGTTPLRRGGRFQRRRQARPRRGQLVNNVSILLGNGAGSFSAAANFWRWQLSVSVAVGDFNGDGKQDLAVANWVSEQRVDLLGQWRGGFQRPATSAAGSFLCP